MQHASKCLNCATALDDEDKFCYNCGQSVKVHQRITMHHVTHEVMHVLTHVDRGFPYLIKELAIQPGFTIKEFLSGKHKKFFNPFSFFFIVLGIYVLSNTFFRPFDSAVDNNGFSSKGQVTQFPPSIKTEKQKAKFLKIQKRLRDAMNFMNTKTNIVLCISTPFLAFIMFLMYRRQLYYAEHLVVMTFINTFLNLLSIVIFTPLMHFTNGTSFYKMVVIVMLLVHLGYMSLVYYRVLDMPHTTKGVLKSIGSVLVAMAGWMLLSFICIFGYVALGTLFKF